mgnify:CR=1 FL=1
MQNFGSAVKNLSPSIGQVHGLSQKSSSPSPAKKKLKKLRKPTITWTSEDIMISIFKAVIAKGPHLIKNNIEKNKAWHETKEHLFLQECMDGYEELKDSLHVVRNMKNNFYQQYDTILDKFGVGKKHGGKPGNLSKFDGDLKELDSLAKQIYLETEAAEERKEAEDPKTILNQVEADTWKVTQSKPLRVKGINGVITDNSVAKKSRDNKSFESVILFILIGKYSNSNNFYLIGINWNVI